jgi:hypothetical protein
MRDNAHSPASALWAKPSLAGCDVGRKLQYLASILCIDTRVMKCHKQRKKAFLVTFLSSRKPGSSSLIYPSLPLPIHTYTPFLTDVEGVEVDQYSNDMMPL